MGRGPLLSRVKNLFAVQIYWLQKSAVAVHTLMMHNDNAFKPMSGELVRFNWINESLNRPSSYQPGDMFHSITLFTMITSRQVSTGDDFTDRILSTIQFKGYVPQSRITQGEFSSVLLAASTNQRSSAHRYVALKFITHATRKRTQGILHPWQSDIPDEVKDVIIRMPFRSVNSSHPSVAYMRQWIGSALVQTMVCRLFGTKPLSESMLGYCLLNP